MKGLIITVILFFGLLMPGMAQNKPTTAEKAANAAQKKANKEQKRMAKETAKAAKSAGSNKDGSPDMRLKKNKDAAKAAQTNRIPAPIPAPTVVSMPKPKKVVTPAPAPAVVTNPNPAQKVTPKVIQQHAAAVKTADKIIGTDEKGRTIYEGRKGGRYYINKNGNKEYVKKG